MYFEPEMEVVELELQGMLASSPTTPLDENLDPEIGEGTPTDDPNDLG